MVRRQSARSNGRRLYAEPLGHPAPKMSRLIDLVLHLAESEHRAAQRARPDDGENAETALPSANVSQTSLAEEGETKEH